MITFLISILIVIFIFCYIWLAAERCPKCGCHVAIYGPFHDYSWLDEYYAECPNCRWNSYEPDIQLIEEKVD